MSEKNNPGITKEKSASVKNGVGRLVIALIAIILEIIVIFNIVISMDIKLGWFSAAARTAAALLVLFIYNQNKTASIKIPWIMLIMILPVVGVTLYLIIGLNLFLNNRDHRKLTVIDGRVGFTGGYNLANEYFNLTHPYGYWKDTGIKITGDAVKSLTVTFLEMWNAIRGDDHNDRDYGRYLPYCHYQAEENGFVVSYADSPMDKKLVYSITRSYYQPLAAGGVRIFEYTPGFSHCKMSIADDSIANCGTINLDYRSLYHHFEKPVDAFS